MADEAKQWTDTEIAIATDCMDYREYDGKEYLEFHAAKWLMRQIRDGLAAQIATLAADNARKRDELDEARAWETVPDGEYPMVENAELDGDFLHITGNEDLEVCTWVERPIETIMLDLGMKIMRRAPAAGEVGDG